MRWKLQSAFNYNHKQHVHLLTSIASGEVISAPKPDEAVKLRSSTLRSEKRGTKTGSETGSVQTLIIFDSRRSYHWKRKSNAFQSNANLRRICFPVYTQLNFILREHEECFREEKLLKGKRKLCLQICLLDHLLIRSKIHYWRHLISTHEFININEEEDVVMFRDMKVLRSLTLYVTQFIISCIYIHQTMKHRRHHHYISLLTRFADKIENSFFCCSPVIKYVSLFVRDALHPHPSTHGQPSILTRRFTITKYILNKTSAIRPVVSLWVFVRVWMCSIIEFPAMLPLLWDLTCLISFVMRRKLEGTERQTF